MLSAEEIAAIDEKIAEVPERRAACIEAMHALQRSRGYVSDEALADLAAHLGMSVAELESVATFYNLVFRRPVGRHVVLACDSVSCWIMGSERVLEAIVRSTGAKVGESDASGRFTVLPIACLGACDRAPAVMVDEELYGDLDEQAVGEILERHR